MRPNKRAARRICVIAAATAGAFTTAAWGNATAQTGASEVAAAGSGVVTVESGQAGTFVSNFNPFSPNAERPTIGLIYEPLFYFDMAKAGAPQPWLAQSYAWSNGGKTITFQLRHNVVWSDGKPFTSADVAYTFKLLQANSALNLSGLPITGASTQGPYTASVTFSQPSYADINYIAGTTYMLPQHVWSAVANPQTYQNPTPVGTGAYTVQSVSNDAMTLVKNQRYYMPGLAKVKAYRFLYFASNTSSSLAISNGSVDWANSYIPNVKTAYLGKNPNFVVSNTPVAITALLPNLTSGPTADLSVRRALSAAINRSQVSAIVYNGYANPIAPDGLIAPNYSEVADPSLAKQSFTYAPAKAKQILEADGYKMGSDGYFAKAGAPLSLTVQVPSGYTDYVQSLQVIQSELQSAGIKLVVDGESVDAWTSNTDTGKFQLVMEYAGFTPSPYAYYKNLIGSQGVLPVGQVDTVGDQGRYKNATVDTLLTKIAGSQNVAAQKPYFYKIEQIFARDLPLIPLFQQQNEGEFNGGVVGNIPSAQNPYSVSGQQQPDLGWVALHLTPKS